MRSAGATWPAMLLLAGLGVAAASCLEAPGFVCAASSECIVNDVQGTCDLPTQTCVYPSGASCPSGYQDGAGNCVDPGPGVSSTSTSASATSAGSQTETSDDDSSASTTTSTSSSSDAGSSTTTSADETSGTSGDAPCGGATENLTSFGVVGASSVFSGYPPGMSVDGELATSWFSTGPEPGNQPSVFNWTLATPRCISRLFISGNGLNSNPDFREGFGFESVTFRILDESMQPQFVQTRELAGTPDPDVSVDVPGVVGIRVELEFSGHESDDCGGFSELQVLGGNAD